MGITVLRGSLSIHSTIDSRCKFAQYQLSRNVVLWLLFRVGFSAGYRGLGRPDKVIACEVSKRQRQSLSFFLDVPRDLTQFFFSLQVFSVQAFF